MNDQNAKSEKALPKHIFTVKDYTYEIGNHKGEIYSVTLIFFGVGKSSIPNEPPAKKVYASFNPDIEKKEAAYDHKNQAIRIYYPMNFLKSVLDLLNNSNNIWIQLFYNQDGSTYADIHGSVKFKYGN
ncbi:hypothetical protein ACFLSE_06650 [Bacteroidota bacterium]